MRRIFYLVLFLLVFSGIGCPPGPRVDIAKKTNDPIADIQVPPPQDLKQLKERIELALDQVRSRKLETKHAFWTVFHGILGMGLERATLFNPDTKEKVNAIEYICNGGEIRGMQFLPTKDGLDVKTARFEDQGEAQGHQDQFIAEMAQWGMRLDRKFRVGGRDYTFEDFTRHSKNRASVKQKQELSWAILIIGQYYGTNITWTNNAGEKLHYDDTIRYELAQPMDFAACGGTHRLFGLTWSYYLHLKTGGKTEGVWRDVEERIQQYKALARKLRNSDGSLSTEYFKGPGANPNLEARISTTGHIVEWLALAMTDDELKSEWMQEAVNALSMMIVNMADRDIESGGLYHAAHGLYLYHERVFGTPPAFLPLPPKK